MQFQGSPDKRSVEKESEICDHSDTIPRRGVKRAAGDNLSHSYDEAVVQECTKCVVCGTSQAFLSFTHECAMPTCQELCNLCEDCADTFNGLEECVSSYPYCSRHHPISGAIQEFPKCVVDGCMVRLDSGDNNDYVCERRQHPYQVMPLRIGRAEHFYIQVRLWVAQQTLLNGDVAAYAPVDHPSDATKASNRDLKHRNHTLSGRSVRPRFTTTETAIEDSITKQGRSWDCDQYHLDTLSKPSRLRIITNLLDARHGSHFQRVICMQDWFKGMTTKDVIAVKPSSDCINCSDAGDTKTQFMGCTLWVCMSAECVHFLSDLCTHSSASFVQTETGVYTEPVYMSMWGARCLRSHIR
jgi:hypothetical protein